NVVVPGGGGRRRRIGIRVHRSVLLTPKDVSLHSGIPVTTPARTFADLRSAQARQTPGAVSSKELRRVLRQANVLGLPLGGQDGPDRTRSDLEAEFLDLCLRFRLPPPEVNVRIGQYLVDFLWRGTKVVVETDGYLSITEGGRPLSPTGAG